MKESLAVIHALLNCETCGEKWENYQTAERLAIIHAESTGHVVSGEAAESVFLNWDKRKT